MFYKKNTQEVIRLLNSNLTGLSKKEAKERLKKY
ncbi:cation-transporting P-type ATPase, partial [Romboutsia ilealis]